MPPSPRLKLALNEERYAELCEAMGLSEPPPVRFRDRLPKGVKTTYGGNGSVFGVYSPATNAVSIFTEQKQYGYDRIRAVNAELVITLLHELRHAWQHKSGQWTHGNVVRDERDAEGYAQENYHRWRGVISLRRETFHSRLPT